MNPTMTQQAARSPRDERDGAHEHGAVSGAPRVWLRLEAVAALAGAAIAYAQVSGRWSLFAVLFLVPDLSMLGYLGGSRIGAACYNTAHSYLGPALLAVLGVTLGSHALPGLACIWAAHVAFDRLLGFGLKYGTNFGDTHLGRVGARSTRTSLVAIATGVPALLLVGATNASAATTAPAGLPAADPPEVSPAPTTQEQGFNLFPPHHFQWAPSDAKTPQVGVNFGLLQLALGGFNVAGEVRYRRLWLEYSHGADLKLNDLGGFSLSGTERTQNLHVVVPYTTGFGVGLTLLDELWLGVEFKTHRYDVNAPGGPIASYQTYSIGPVLGYKVFVWKGLYANAYARYWPNVASTLGDNKIALSGTKGTVSHAAHDFGLFANVSIGYAFDL